MSGMDGFPTLRRCLAGGLFHAGVVSRPARALTVALVAFGLVSIRLAPAARAQVRDTNAAERSLASWSFTRAGTQEGWVANAHLTDVIVRDGVLSCRATGPDPILELQPRLDLPVTPWQVVEIRLQADRDGMAELFWSPTDTGRFGGFSQERTLRFPVRGDGTMRTYRLRPFWQVDGRLRRLRLDLFDGATFAWAGLRILEPSNPAPAFMPEFAFGPDAAATGWRGVDGAQLRSGPDGWEARLLSAESMLLGPPVAFEAEARTWAGIRFAVDRGRRGTLLFATASAPGLHRLSFPIEADGREHTYNLDLLAGKEWRGRIVALGLKPSDDPDATARLRWLRVANQPQGDAELQILSWGVEDALPRANRAVTLTARVRNRGGAAASNLLVRPVPPPDWVLESAVPPGDAAVLAPGAELRRSWRARGPTGSVEFPLHVEAASVPLVEARTRIEVTPNPAAAGPAAYVPEPRPVRGPFEVGVYYFPGWPTAGPWEPIRDFPERKPVLGWYREGDPEVADWHIKWAVEHGITFFAYDWYWSRGARQLEHGLHDGYLKARYRHLLKFCLLWANHNAPGTSSADDCLAVTRHWIAHYFRLPEHLRIDGKPVMIVFSPDRLSADLGSAQVKTVFDRMRRECADAGLAGLYLVACVPDAGVARQCAAEGYDAVTAYTWPHLGVPAGELFAPFATLPAGYQRQWNHIADTAGIPLIPPICGGWDSRPWHGDHQFVRYDRTPALLAAHLRDARAFVEERTRSAPASVQPVVLIEAWNEFGEGSYIEPHAEFGFGYLDAVREVFGGPAATEAHLDLTPADIGRGPYDVVFPDRTRTDWAPAEIAAEWTQTMDLADIRVEGDAWAARTTGNDPALFGPSLRLPAAGFGSVEIRLRLAPAVPGTGAPRDVAQLFWRTSTLPESEACSVRFPVELDGEWHDYHVPLGSSARWRGQITRLRLDPGNRGDVRVAVARIRLVTR